LQALRVFLRVYGALSLALFTSLLLGFIVRFQPLDSGRPMHWVIWDRLTDHVGPMLFVIYMVWSIYLIRAAADPLKHQSFLDFTMWANLAHGLLMVPYSLTEPEYHSKIPDRHSLATGVICRDFPAAAVRYGFRQVRARQIFVAHPTRRLECN
jgi:hypothetical protein